MNKYYIFIHSYFYFATFIIAYYRPIAIEIGPKVTVILTNHVVAQTYLRLKNFKIATRESKALGKVRKRIF